MTLWAAAALLAAQTAAAGRFDPPDLAEVPFKALSVDQYSDAVDARAAKGDYEGALDIIAKALAKNPKSVQLRFQRCVVLEKSGDTEAARRELNRFTAMYPEIPEPYNNLAAIESSAGNLDKAEELLKTALRLRPAFRNARINLANLYLVRALTNYKEAQEQKAEPALAERIPTLSKLIEKLHHQEPFHLPYPAYSGCGRSCRNACARRRFCSRRCRQRRNQHHRRRDCPET